ncbi:MAG: type VI secretion system tube protein Hcp, partial [Bryobacteraceae bacterium]
MYDSFLKIDGIPGESTDDAHKDWIEILDYNHEVRQPASATVSSAGGAGAERVEHDDILVVKLLDKSTPKLLEACCKGTHIKEVIMEMCRAGGDKVKYMEVKMEEVIISSVKSAGSAKGQNGFPTESLS